MPKNPLAPVTGAFLLLLCATAVAAGPADVTLRVEGQADTLLPRVALRTTTTTVNKDGQAGHDCTGTSAAGALQQGTAGDWGGQWFDGFGYSVERIRGERHAFPEPDFFTLWVNDRESQTGLCQTELQQGDEVLIFVARCEFDGQRCANAPVLPLDLAVPAGSRPGAPFRVTVVEHAPDGTPSPVAGATVSGGDAPAATDAGGEATVTVSARGARGLRATRANRAPSATETVCATDGADGFCGTRRPDGTTIEPAPAAAAAGGTLREADRRRPRAAILGLREGATFASGRGPRELRGTAGTPTAGVRDVKLRLTRTDRGRCTTFSGSRERFVRPRRGRCGAANGYWLRIGDRDDWRYLLPSRLPRGRYVLDVNAIDRAFARDDQRRRGQNRIVFRVR